jgi:predicted DCC family thiol-disulfide oxidoreductase YuxK
VPTSLITGPVLVFDGDCAFCTSSVLWLQNRFPDGFSAVPYQRVELGRLGLTERECHDRVQWIADAQTPRTSRRESGARAVGALLRSGGRARGDVTGLLWATAGVLPFVPPTSWLAEGVYRVVAANRMRLPGGTPACAA